MKDINVLEKVQSRKTRMVDECKGKDCEEKLRVMSLTTLETKRLRADLLEVYKIMRGLEEVRKETFFTRRKGTSFLIHSNKLLIV